MIDGESLSMILWMIWGLVQRGTLGEKEWWRTGHSWQLKGPQSFALNAESRNSFMVDSGGVEAVD